MNANIFFAIMLLSIDAVSSRRIEYQSCASQTRGEIISLDMTPCDQDPCVFRRGNQETFTMKFIPRETIASPKIYANGIMGSMSIPLSINPDACQGYGLNCPLMAGVEAELVFSMALPRFYIPPGEYAIEAYIKDQNDNVVVCGKIFIEIA